MKDIRHMNLAEYIEALQSLEEFTLLKDIDTGNFEPTYDSMKKNAVELADRIRDLTRWIPVSERMPTEEDANEDGCVLVSATERSKLHRVVEIWSYEYVSRNGLGGYKPTHWKRITQPETP